MIVAKDGSESQTKSKRQLLIPQGGLTVPVLKIKEGQSEEERMGAEAVNH
jgi:hypothetical protein